MTDQLQPVRCRAVFSEELPMTTNDTANLTTKVRQPVGHDRERLSTYTKHDRRNRHSKSDRQPHEIACTRWFWLGMLLLLLPVV